MSARRAVYGIYAIRQLLYNVVALGGGKRADDLFARSIGRAARTFSSMLCLNRRFVWNTNTTCSISLRGSMLRTSTPPTSHTSRYS